jgi:hypothetical protein
LVVGLQLLVRLPYPGHHVIEALGEGAELVTAAHRDPGIQIALFAYPAQGAQDGIHRSGDAHRQEDEETQGGGRRRYAAGPGHPATELVRARIERLTGDREGQCTSVRPSLVVTLAALRRLPDQP